MSQPSIVSEARVHAQAAIAELRRNGVQVPTSLYRCAHTLAYGQKALDLFFTNDSRGLDDRGMALLKAIVGSDAESLIRGAVR